jgi:hypothetical protein
MTANARVLRVYNLFTKLCPRSKCGRGGGCRLEVKTYNLTKDAPQSGSFRRALAYESTGAGLSPDTYPSDVTRTGYIHIILYLRSSGERLPAGETMLKAG